MQMLLEFIYEASISLMAKTLDSHRDLGNAINLPTLILTVLPRCTKIKFHSSVLMLISIVVQGSHNSSRDGIQLNLLMQKIRVLAANI